MRRCCLNAEVLPGVLPLMRSVIICPYDHPQEEEMEIEPVIPQVLTRSDLYLLKGTLELIVKKVEGNIEKATQEERTMSMNCQSLLNRIVSIPSKGGE